MKKSRWRGPEDGRLIWSWRGETGWFAVDLDGWSDSLPEETEEPLTPVAPRSSSVELEENLQHTRDLLLTWILTAIKELAEGKSETVDQTLGWKMLAGSFPSVADHLVALLYACDTHTAALILDKMYDLIKKGEENGS